MGGIVGMYVLDDENLLRNRISNSKKMLNSYEKKEIRKKRRR